jgi:3-oxoacyl-[acyl-carrier-protein] synthase II
LKRRVVVTGIGLITPCGVGTEPTWAALLEGKSGIGPITKFDAAKFDSRIAGEVRGFDPEPFIGKKDVKKMDLFIHYAVAAAAFAQEQSGLTITPENAERVGVLIGSGIGGMNFFERQHQILLERGPDRLSPFLIPGMIVNLASGQVSIRTGAKGPNSAVCTACATGTHAIGDSFRLIQNGFADAMITGGTEGVITPLAVGGFCAMKALSTRNDSPETASRPFDLDRDGFVMGEGAGILVIEELEHARRRGAKILAEIAGYGMSSDAYHISSPSEDGDGPIRVMGAALKDAGVEPKDLSYINAHGTSTPAGDRIEALAIKTVFGEHAKKIPVSSTKSAMGHLLGAAGGVETAVCILAVGRDVIPPTINLTKPDPECDLDFVPNKARRAEVRWALNNSFGFGGTNASILVGKYRD